MAEEHQNPAPSTEPTNAPPVNLQADNNTQISAKRVVGRPFEPGRSGNPGGRRKAPERCEELEEALERGSIIAVSTLQGICEDPRAAKRDRIAASRILLEHKRGKPVHVVMQQVEDNRAPSPGTTVNVNLSTSNLTGQQARALIREGRAPREQLEVAEMVLNEQAAKASALAAPEGVSSTNVVPFAERSTGATDRE
jgi:hypothetical protein